MIAEGQRQMTKAGVENISWLQGDSTNLSIIRSVLRLTTMGRSFHWTERDETLAKLHSLTKPGGGVVIVNDASLWENTDNGFPSLVKRVIQRWLGDRRRAGNGYASSSLERHEPVIARSAFELTEQFVHEFERPWTIDQIIGYCYSTSYCSERVLGDKKEAFERDLRDALVALSPTGTFVEKVQLEAFLLHRNL